MEGIAIYPIYYRLDNTVLDEIPREPLNGIMPNADDEGSIAVY